MWLRLGLSLSGLKHLRQGDFSIPLLVDLEQLIHTYSSTFVFYILVKTACYPEKLFEDNKTSWRHNMLRWHLLSLLMWNFPGLSGDSKNTNTGVKTESHTSSSRRGAKVSLILVGFVAVAMFSFFLYKLWQKKKRDEQYARLLKLFEEDDELEVELGLRD